MVLSLSLVFVILVYIDPLRLMASVLLNWLSGGYLPSLLVIEAAEDLTQLFALFGFLERAIETMPRTCFSPLNSACRLGSSEPPAPVPVGSPVCAINPAITR